MISKYFGRDFTLQELRQKSSLTREGVSLLGISAAAESVGFNTIAVKINFEKLKNEAPLPCIVHWNSNHFVVVYQIKKEKVFIADPELGKLTYKISEFLDVWIGGEKSQSVGEGIALLLRPTAQFYVKDEDVKPSIGFNYSFLLSYLKPHKGLVLQLVIGLILASIVQLFFPFLTQSIVDVGIQNRDINFIYLILIGQCVLIFVETFIEFLRRWILLHLSTRINVSMLSDFLIKLMDLPLSFFDQKILGDILKRVEDHSRIQQLLSASSLSVLFSFSNVLVFGSVLLLYNVQIFAVYFLLSALYVGYVLIFLRKRKELDYKSFNQSALSQSSVIQLIQGITEIKLNNSERKKRWSWEKEQASMFKTTIRSTNLQQIQEGGSTVINTLKNLFITILAAKATLEGEMTLGMMLSVQYIIGSLNGPINNFIGFMLELQDAIISMERIGEVYELSNEDNSKNSISHIGFHLQDLQIEKLTFQYEDSDSAKILDDVTLVIPKNKMTAIVGSSGSGKTTLLKLLLKFYTPSQGKILIGENDLQNISTATWRSSCGVVMQNGFIFSDTIANNIALSGEEIDHDELLKAARIANIHEHIISLPLGYNSKVGADGAGLSQGQKQRLLIARAVYKAPHFFFFDEATSALDTTNERQIMQNLDIFCQGRTTVVIAHRLSTVKRADQIVVMSKGKIVEIGTHKELSEKKGDYYKLVSDQLEMGE
jgi:ATP-binding cassette subfamily B protein